MRPRPLEVGLGPGLYVAHLERQPAGGEEEEEQEVGKEEEEEEAEEERLAGRGAQRLWTSGLYQTPDLQERAGARWTVKEEEEQR